MSNRFNTAHDALRPICTVVVRNPSRWTCEFYRSGQILRCPAFLRSCGSRSKTYTVCHRNDLHETSQVRRLPAHWSCACITQWGIVTQEGYRRWRVRGIVTRRTQ